MTRSSPETAAARAHMVRVDLRGRGIADPRVLDAMGRVARERFVPEPLRDRAYRDSPLPIGWDQTISQPYIVARMTEAAGLAPGMRVLEIGTGSGYQAAVLAELGCEVYSIEIVEPLARAAGEALAAAGYPVHLRYGDGYAGWPEAAPFDAILLTAAPPRIPPPLLAQLAVGGRLVAPVGGLGMQDLVRVTRTADGRRTEVLLPVSFVPMTGTVRSNQD